MFGLRAAGSAYFSQQPVINGEGAGTTKDKRGKTSQVKQVRFEPRFAKMRTVRRDGLKLYGRETVLQVDSEDSDQENGRHWNADERNERSQRNAKSSENFRYDREPRKKMREWQLHRLQDAGETVCAT